MRVLNLITNPNATFYDLQTRALEALGVRCDTLPVPGSSTWGPDSSESRTVVDYVRYYPQVLQASLDDYDVVHANYGLTGPFALAQPRRPVVLGLWGSDLFGTYGPVSRACAKFADETIVMSPGMADELGQPCHVIPHAVDTERFTPTDAAAAKEKLGWDSDHLHVLFPYAPTREVKNFPRARQVVDRVRERVDDPVELHPLGDVDHADMPIHYNAADVVLVTSTHEGSPNAVKEALACNVPVVSTDVGDVAQRLDGVVHSQVADTDVELAAAVAEALRADGRSDGRAVAQELSVEQMGERLRQVYRSALDA